ncbi:MAG TPA: nucleoside recognition domain-containing protein [Bacteroidota bacterium]|nr:nucleoside recognition domain-containing protein [Bacteroidota bacterium]
MLNYIWMSLIAIGILVAVGNDIRDEVQNPYRNGIPFEASVTFQRAPGPLRNSWEGDMTIPAEAFNGFYAGKSTSADVHQPVTINVVQGGATSITLPIVSSSPDQWKEMAKSAASKEKLVGVVKSMAIAPGQQSARVQIVLEPIRFVKMKAVTQAALDYATTAVTIALGLIGVMALWLGVMKVAEEAGLLKIVTRLLTPVTRRLFPEIPTDHPAIGAMIMNIAANMLGLSNAATPLGLKAMEELNKINPKAGTATNSMITFLTINTGGLILIPATAIAVRASAGSVNPGIIIGTSIFGAGCATVAGVAAAKILQRLPRYKKDLEIEVGKEVSHG